MAKQPDRTAAPKPKPVEILLNEAETDTLRTLAVVSRYEFIQRQALS